MQAFLSKLMQSATDAGFESAEAYVLHKQSFHAMTNEGEVDDYSSNETCGLGFRGVLNGKMGYSATEAFDEEAIDQLIKGATESAELCEDPDPVFLYEGNEATPAITLHHQADETITPDDKIKAVLQMEQIAKNYDPRIDQVGDNIVATGTYTVQIINTHGLNRSYTESMAALYTQPTAKEDERISAGGFGMTKRTFADLDPKAVAMEASKRAIDLLHATSMPSGKYQVIFFSEAMTSLMSVFSTIFSAETAQKGLSLLAGKLGTDIASSSVTLVDDPLLAGGMQSRPFDAEGVPSKAHPVIENGVFKTFLHNLKTAHMDGVQTTGNASKAGYASAVHVSPSNLCFQVGEQSLDALMQSIQNGFVITELAGLHSGANAISGDFSLLAKGYAFENGKRTHAVEQVTVAGNFYEMLTKINAFANDFYQDDNGMCSASVDVGELSISGT